MPKVPITRQIELRLGARALKEARAAMERIDKVLREGESICAMFEQPVGTLDEFQGAACITCGRPITQEQAFVQATIMPSHWNGRYETLRHVTVHIQCPVSPSEPASEADIRDWKSRIKAMSLEEMGTLWRFAESGHVVFRRDGPLFDVFREKFTRLGGWSPELSKRIGWGKP